MPYCDRDYCPVCGDARPIDARRTYCSNKCMTSARKLRRRMEPTLKYFQKLDFKFRWNCGVFLQVTIPEFMQPYFPEAKPNKPLYSYWLDSADTYNYESFDKEMTELFGKVLFGAMQINLNDCGNNPALAKDSTKRFMDFMLQTNYGTFVCADCQTKFIQCPLNNIDAGDVCNKCTVERIPF